MLRVLTSSVSLLSHGKHLKLDSICKYHNIKHINQDMKCACHLNNKALPNTSSACDPILKQCHVQFIGLELQLSYFTGRTVEKNILFAIHASIQSSHSNLLKKSIIHARHDSTTHNPNCQIESDIGSRFSDEHG